MSRWFWRFILSNGFFMLTIGLLIPNSGMLTRFGRGFKTALELGLGEQKEKVNIVIETGGSNAGPISVKAGLERLIVNHEPDLIIAPLSVSVLPDIENLLLAEEIPLLVTTLGENRLSDKPNNDIVRICSYGLWESAWLTAYHAVKEYGPLLTMVSAFHDCGYGFGEATSLGAQAAGGEVVNNVVTRKERATGARTSRAQSFADVFNTPTDSLILNYSTDGIVRLNNMLSLADQRLPMQALAMTVDETSLTPELQQLDGLSSFLPKGHSRTGDDFKKFAELFSFNSKKRAPNVYCFLAYQVGQTLSEILQQEAICLAIDNGDSLYQLSDAFLASEQTPLFERRVLELKSNANNLVSDLELPDLCKQQRSEYKTDELMSGWFNPYLIA